MEIYYKLSNQLRNGFYFVTYVLHIVLVGLRWETGTDWGTYYYHFGNISDLASTSPFLTGMEYGYSLLCWFSKLFCSSFSLLLIIHSILYYFLIFKGIKNLSPFIFVSVLLFSSFTMGIMGSHRQLIAVAIILFSMKYILERKVWTYMFFILLAFIFHASAFICILLYFVNVRIPLYILLISLFLAFVIGKTAIPGTLFTIMGNIGGAGAKVIAYLESGKDLVKEYGVTIAGLIKRLLFIGIFLYGRNKLEKQIPQYNLMLNSYLVGIIIYFLFSSTLTVMVSRGSLYFNIFEPLLLSCQLLMFKMPKERLLVTIVLFVLSILYFNQSIAEYPDLFLPYKGLFINSDFIRDYPINY